MAGEPEWTYDRHDKASTDDAGPHATRRTDSAMTIASSGALGGCLRMNPLAPGGVTVDIKLARSDRVFHAGEALVGEVVLTSNAGPVHHNGLRVTASGSVQMRVSERAVGVFEAFFLNVRPVPLLSETLEVCVVSRLHTCRPCLTHQHLSRPPCVPCAGGGARGVPGGCHTLPVFAAAQTASRKSRHASVRDLPRHQRQRAGACHASM